MVHLRLLLLPILLLTTLAKSATLDDSICPPCPVLLQSSSLEARTPPVASGNFKVLKTLYWALHSDWQRMVSEAEQLGLHPPEEISPEATTARINALLKASHSTHEAMRRVLDQMHPPGVPGSLKALQDLHMSL
ncbi:hypothetical protein CF336_g7561 [Tilletia laevis]|uniref:Uncharacterized protein n=1 Tax=Tilletia caries TaxID=13290 RepID=A0A177UM66_9BASI|nr:hypothetical protein CF335_g8819 [Tilletia laevis]KAE8185062.1 hypothetical protein CF336_g7561 [Tilletia laevis]KAE8243311.1 hypothetical protein A4X03_0g7797 [Tilletia caries]